ncbi:hypothetical protein [Sulfobacillus thermosulfidooxidans]|uniref:hypothetical protein n=1 Tax=Sulfobacillus thermosulfidooxidans TaxID=28034 RepID=UPI0002EA7987|nr:hypothetical protein [Sulfobacillus thermosulfidooxidans]
MFDQCVLCGHQMREAEPIYAISVLHNTMSSPAAGPWATIHAWDGVCGDCIDSLMDDWVRRRRNLRASS